MADPSLIDQVMDALLVTLAGTEQVGERIYEDRSYPFEKEEAPAIDVRLSDADGRTMGDDGPVRSVLAVTMQVQLAIYTRSSIDAAGRELSSRKLAASVWTSAHARLMADPTLGGLAMRLRWLRASWSKDSADGTAGWAVHTYSLTLAMREHNLLAPVH